MSKVIQGYKEVKHFFDITTNNVTNKYEDTPSLKQHYEWDKYRIRIDKHGINIVLYDSLPYGNAILSFSVDYEDFYMINCATSKGTCINSLRKDTDLDWYTSQFTIYGLCIE